MSTMIAAFGLILAPALPLLMALLWCVPGLRARVAGWTPWAALPALLLALGGQSGASVQLDWIMFGTVLGLNELNRVFLTVTATLWLGAGVYARGYLAGDARVEQFCLLWLATMAGNIGLILAQDVASFYASFALMTFAAYGLVIHARSAQALRAGRVYLAMAVVGEALILTGLMLAASGLDVPLLPMLAALPEAIAESAHRDLIITCLFFGFGIKAGLPLLHMWLPLAHPVAPIPASAVLSGAMIKAGLLGWISTLPFGLISLPHWSLFMMGTGLLAAFGAAFIGVHQQTPKTVLAYSSISQMGLITVGVGAGLHDPKVWPVLGPAIALYALHHGLAKGALFLGVGIVGHRGGRLISPLLWLALALPGLSLAGPMFSGMAAKLSLKAALAAGSSIPAWWQHLPLLLGLAAIGTTSLIARYLWLLLEVKPGHPATRSVWLGWGMVLGASTFGLVALPWLPVAAGWPPDLDYLPDLAWPVLVGVILALLAVRHLRAWPIPAGDGVVALEWVFAALVRGWRGFRVVMRRHTRKWRWSKPGAKATPSIMSLYGNRLEQTWRRDAGLIFAALLVVMLLATVLG
ncbi:MAG: complex I subunit 5 family protein [Azoarcus sp.]|nr:complex I subunit 5 family protein [Azoarcus sp.]